MVNFTVIKLGGGELMNGMIYKEFEEIKIELEDENDSLPEVDTHYLDELLKVKKAEIDKILKAYKRKSLKEA